MPKYTQYRKPSLVSTYKQQYQTEAESLGSGATEEVEIYYTAQADGDGYYQNPQSDTPAAGKVIQRKLYYAHESQKDPDDPTGWVLYSSQPADDTAFIDAKETLLDGLKEVPAGEVPLSLKMTWEEVASFSGLLDDYPGAIGAWALRRLSSSYAGDCIRIRRASDNTEMDIGFKADGTVDTGSIETFCSGTDGYVVTIYDQSGSGDDVTMVTTSAQGKIHDSVTATTVDPDTMLPAILGGATVGYESATFAHAQPATYYSVHNATSFPTAQFAWSGDDEDGLGLRYDPPGRIYVYPGAVLVHNDTTGCRLITGVYNGASSEFFKDGTSVATPSIATTGQAGITLMRRHDNSKGLQGYFSELIVYPNAGTDRAAIETHINDYHSIY